MIYPDNFENKIEFDAVRRMLKEYTLCRLGEERVDDMQFMTDFKAINLRLDEVVEFVRILQLEQNFPSDYYYDVREPLLRIRISGMYMGEEELFSLRRSLDTIGRMLSLLRKQGDGSESGEDNPLYPNLRRLAGDIDVLPSLLRAIDAIIDKFGYYYDKEMDIYHFRYRGGIQHADVAGFHAAFDRQRVDMPFYEFRDFCLHEQYFYPEFPRHQPNYFEKLDSAATWCANNGFEPIFMDELFEFNTH